MCPASKFTVISTVFAEVEIRNEEKEGWKGTECGARKRVWCGVR